MSTRTPEERAQVAEDTHIRIDTLLERYLRFVVKALPVLVGCSLIIFGLLLCCFFATLGAMLAGAVRLAGGPF